MEYLNRTTAPQAVRFMFVCFRQGVLDACEYGDDMGVKEFVDAHKASWTFGILGEPDDYDWQAFRVKMYSLARRNHLGGFAENYIFRIRQRNYLWCLLPYCLQFYIMGLEEWLAYPNPQKIAAFKKAGSIHWDPNYPYKQIKRMDIINSMQEMALLYRRIPEEDRLIGATTMDGFIEAVYNLTRKYVTGRQIDWEAREAQGLQTEP